MASRSHLRRPLNAFALGVTEPMKGRKVLIGVSGFVAVVCGFAILLTGVVFAFYGVAVLLFGEFHGRTTGVFYLVFAIAILSVGYVFVHSGWRSLRAPKRAAQQGAPADAPSVRR